MPKRKQPDQEIRLLHFVYRVANVEHEKRHTFFIGIDPGADGAVGIIAGSHKTVLDIPAFKVKRGSKKSKTAFDHGAIVSLFDCLDCVRSRVVACVEEPPPSMGPGKGSAYSQFRLGVAFSMWPLFLLRCGFRVQTVSPSVWKKKMGVTSDKNRSLAMARKLFPSPLLRRMKDHNRAEAILLAEYCRRYS